MSIPLAQHLIAIGFVYQHHPDHRNGTTGKSQWIVTEANERAIFDSARTSRWLAANLGWGIHVLAGRAEYLGEASNGGRRLLVAKFVAGNNPKIWHGYPADHQKRIEDIPNATILRDWMQRRFLNAAKVRKLMRGQPCNL
jgi:hypothetical protein